MTVSDPLPPLPFFEAGHGLYLKLLARNGMEWNRTILFWHLGCETWAVMSRLCACTAAPTELSPPHPRAPSSSPCPLSCVPIHAFSWLPPLLAFLSDETSAVVLRELGMGSVTVLGVRHAPGEVYGYCTGIKQCNCSVISGYYRRRCQLECGVMSCGILGYRVMLRSAHPNSSDSMHDQTRAQVVEWHDRTIDRTIHGSKE